MGFRQNAQQAFWRNSFLRQEIPFSALTVSANFLSAVLYTIGMEQEAQRYMLEKRNIQRQKTAGGARARRAGLPFLYFAAAGVLSCAEAAGVGSPFGVAFAAAACRTGNGFAAVLGTFAGYLLSHPGAEGVQYAGAALIVLTAATVFSGVGVAASRWFFPACAAGAVGVTGCIFLIGEAWDWQAVVLFACRIALAAGAAYFYEAALDTVRGRPQVIRFGGMLVLAATVLMAAYPFQVVDLICPARIAALLSVMAVGYMGGFSYGAACGVGIGIAMDAAGGAGLYYAGIYAIAGMIAGFFQRSGRVVYAIVFVLTHAAVNLFGGQEAYLSGLYECFVASVCFVLVPDRTWRTVQDRLLPPNPEPTDYAARVCRIANHYASVVSDAFSEMYQALAGGSRHKEENDLGAVFDRAADRVCRRCSARQSCWERDKLATLRTLDSISGPLLRSGHVVASDFPGHFAAQCLRFSDFVVAVNEGMDALYQRRQAQRRNEAGRRLIAQQYAGVTGILKQVGESMGAGPEALPSRERELRTYAEAFGRVRTAAAWKDRRGRLHFELSGECVTRIIRNREGFLSGLSALMNVRLVGPESVHGPGGLSLLFREREPYCITVGVGTRTREGQKVSGDCIRYFTTEEGIACVLLSDGMGSGEQAREDAESTVRMAEQFLRAGISAADSVRTIGPALKLRTQGRQFVTLDVSTIDLFTGAADSVKCGAAPSFVRAVDGDGTVRVRRILSSTLPAGLEESGEMDVTQFRMGDGDALLLLSDGIVDADGSNAGWVEELLAGSMHLSARELAARIVLEGSVRGAPDDMSAAVVYLTRRDS